MGLSGERIALVLLALALLFAALGWWRATRRVGRENRARQVRAFAGESAAEALLAAHGFRIVDRQVTARFEMTVDGEPVVVTNRCDLLVERGGSTFVADVKTGVRATDPTHPATRRQLLEYALVHEADGVLLVDMEADRVVEVDFPWLSDRRG